MLINGADSEYSASYGYGGVDIPPVLVQTLLWLRRSVASRWIHRQPVTSRFPVSPVVIERAPDELQSSKCAYGISVHLMSGWLNLLSAILH
ncbi:hypothetical protein GDO78_016888 [Eleutherodactylus coqui]|uniref:Uncharacterized protein n=1 Tax=Eleutherodactylus coqui TaxID=57060 RepID=A0A8J6E607_ELECQ|nr:hypothetical protein GDO78_016888 [Eleutherodactylus coqui]